MHTSEHASLFKSIYVGLMKDILNRTISREVHTWLDMNGYTVEQFIKDDKITRKCVISLMRSRNPND